MTYYLLYYCSIATLLPNTISSSTATLHVPFIRSYRLSSIKFYFLHYIVARHTLCTVLNRSYRAMCLLFVFQPIYNVWVLITTCLPRVLCDAITKTRNPWKRSTRRFFYRSPLPLSPPSPSTFFPHREKILSTLCFLFSFLSIFRSTETINLFDFTLTFIFHSNDTLPCVNRWYLAWKSGSFERIRNYTICLLRHRYY